MPENPHPRPTAPPVRIKPGADAQMDKPNPVQVIVSESTFGLVVRVRINGRMVRLGPAATAAILQARHELAQLRAA